jgi:histidyl-tRNA synthetase
MMKRMRRTRPQTLKGFRDFLPAEMAIRQKVINTLEKVFRSYGFEPLETPALEYAATLLGKYGLDADRLVYTFQDQGKRKVGLRYDLTVPVSRVLAQYRGKIPLPFKRYQIQNTWRAEKPQKSRYREFTQCDIDSFGSTSPLADAEIIAVIYNSLKLLKFQKFTIRINSRQVLFKLISTLGIKEEKKQLSILRSVDKLDKSEPATVEDELGRNGLSERKIKKLFSLIDSSKPDENLKQLFKYLKNLGVKKNFYQFDPTLVRGLDYYTGPVFETSVQKPKIGSITGGGRYNKLISQLGGPDIPATGTTIGLDRICDVIKEQNLWPELRPTPTQVLITIFSPKYLEESIKTATTIRSQMTTNTELYLNPKDKLDKQLKYADRKGIPYVIVIGPDEVKNKTVTLKDMKTGKQKTIPLKAVYKELK